MVEPRPDSVGLCFGCRWKRGATTRRGSVFFRCVRADVDPGLARYPALPVLACHGYEVAMLFVVLMHYTRPIEAVDAVRAAHVAHLERHAREGVFRAWARRSPPSGGVIVAAASDRAALDRIVATDPYITAGVASAEIVEFNPANVRLAL